MDANSDDNEYYSTLYRTLVIMAKVNGIISIIGSSLILYDLSRDKNQKQNQHPGHSLHHQNQGQSSVWNRFTASFRLSSKKAVTPPTPPIPVEHDMEQPDSSNRPEDEANDDNNNDDNLELRRPPSISYPPSESLRLSTTPMSGADSKSPANSQVSLSQPEQQQPPQPAQRPSPSTSARRMTRRGGRRNRNNAGATGNNNNSPTSTRNQILYCLSWADLFSSFVAHVLGSWMVPKGQVYGSAGNITTCNIQGFLGTTVSAMSILFNVALAASFLIAVRASNSGLVKTTSASQRSCMDKWFRVCWFPFCTLVPLLLGIGPFFFTAYNWTGRWACGVNASPHECDINENVECKRGEDAESVLLLSLVLPFALSAVFLVASMALLYWTVLQQERAGDKYAVMAQPQNNNDNMDPEQAREQRKAAKRAMKTRKWSRRVAQQGIAFVGAFFATYAFYIMSSILSNDPVWLQLLAGFCLPLQGFFNAYVYFRPKFLARRRKQKAMQRRREQLLLQQEALRQERLQQDGETSNRDDTEDHSHSTNFSQHHNMPTGMTLLDWHKLTLSSNNYQSRMESHVIDEGVNEDGQTDDEEEGRATEVKTEKSPTTSRTLSSPTDSTSTGGSEEAEEVQDEDDDDEDDGESIIDEKVFEEVEGDEVDNTERFEQE